MIWHILKKDFRLSWKVALVSALLQWLDAALVVAMGTLGEHALPGSAGARMQPIRQVIHILAFAAVVLTAVSVVQNDRFTTSADDWLVRPIRRLDAMLAKFLFFAVAIMGPVFIGSAAMGMALGLGIPDSIYGAAMRVVATALWIGPFSLAMGALTSGMLEAVVGALGCVVLFGFTFFAGNAVQSAAYYGDHETTVFGGLTAGIAIGGLAGFAMQFSRNRTQRSRVISLLLFAAGAGIALLPPNAAAALSRRAEGLSMGAWRLHLKLDPGLGRQRAAADASLLPAGVNGDRDLSWLAFRIDGLRSDEWIAQDLSGPTEAVITDAEGERRVKHPFVVTQAGVIWLGVHGNGRRNLQHSVRVAANYAFYVLRPAGTYAFPEPGSEARIPGLGRCGVTNATRNGYAAFICTSLAPSSACYDFQRGSDRRGRLWPFCGKPASNFLSLLWDWNGAQTSSTTLGNPNLPDSVVLQEREGYFAGRLELDNVQPGDWWAPPQAQ